jgi:hypothetical protein
MTNPQAIFDAHACDDDVVGVPALHDVDDAGKRHTVLAARRSG